MLIQSRHDHWWKLHFTPEISPFSLTINSSGTTYIDLSKIPSSNHSQSSPTSAVDASLTDLFLVLLRIINYATSHPSSVIISTNPLIKSPLHVNYYLVDHHSHKWSFELYHNYNIQFHPEPTRKSRFHPAPTHPQKCTTMIKSPGYFPILLCY